MKRMATPPLSPAGQQALDPYIAYLETEADLRPATIRNYRSDVRLFIAWCEATWAAGESQNQPFAPERVTTPTITRYRDYLQHDLRRKPAAVNRYLVSLKRYFAWATDTGWIPRDPSRVVRLVEQTWRPPRHLSDQEESDLVAAVSEGKNRRDYTLVLVFLHTGLRVSEICQLKWRDVTVKQRSGHLRIWGKGNKYREVPLNATARQALVTYVKIVPGHEDSYVFTSQRTKSQLSPRGIGFLIARYAEKAGIQALRPHDLRHRFGYRMAEHVPLHRLAQIMGHDSLDTTMIYIRGTQQDLQQAVERIAWE